MNYNLIAWNYNYPMNAAAYHKWNRLILLWLIIMSLILLRILVPLFISACHSFVNRSQMTSSTDWVALSVLLPLIVLRDWSIQWLIQVTLVLASLFQWTSLHFRNLPLCPAFMFAFDISAPQSSSPASHSLASLTLLSSHLCIYFLSFVLIWPEGQRDKLITFLC